jgi:hypothetical protein
MRRKVIWVAAAVILIAAAALYAAYWVYAAGLVRQGIADWIEARRQEGYTVGAERIAVGGFPFALRARLDGVVLQQERAAPGYELRLPVLRGETAPWSPRRWTLHGEEGGRLRIDPGPARAALVITASRLSGQVEPTPLAPDLPPGGMSLAIAGEDLVIVGDERLHLDRASLRAALPAHARVGHLETWTRAALRLERLTLPAAGPLGDTLDDLALTASVKGSVPPGALRQGLARWRDDGGTLEIEQLRLAWGKLLASAVGTIALDGALQPIGSATATVQGHNEVVDALVGGGTIASQQGIAAKLIIGALAKPGPDGRPQITAPLRIQNSEIYLGPARLGRLPRFTWE